MENDALLCVGFLDFEGEGFGVGGNGYGLFSVEVVGLEDGLDVARNISELGGRDFLRVQDGIDVLEQPERDRFVVWLTLPFLPSLPCQYTWRDPFTSGCQYQEPTPSYGPDIGFLCAW